MKNEVVLEDVKTFEISESFTNYLKTKYDITITDNSKFVPDMVDILLDPDADIPEREDIVETISERAAEPIKDVKDIKAICNHFISTGKLRDYLMFIVGIHTGLRVYDLRHLRFCDFLNPDGTFKDELVLLEHKTKNSRKVKRNRHIPIHDEIKIAMNIYLNKNKRNYSDYMFISESNNGSSKKKPLARFSVQRILVNAAEQVGITSRVGTHTLRKTFGFHFVKNNSNNHRMLYLLQQAFGHSSEAITLRYIGLTADEIRDIYLSFDVMNDSQNNNKKVGTS